MNAAFSRLVGGLEQKLEQLLAMPPVTYGNLPGAMPERAVYLFSEGGRHLYVGRTNHLRNRLRGHCAPSARRFSAALASRIARQDTGLIRATYGAEDPRLEVTRDPVFAPAFEAAKHRVSKMELRFVEEEHPVRQALLEIYVATALETPYNDFDRP